MPISIHYGRIAEENAYDAERAGEEKQKESFGALLRARSVLSQRHGNVYVTFAEPRSLRELLGDRAERFAGADKDEAADEELKGLEVSGEANDDGSFADLLSQLEPSISTPNVRAIGTRFGRVRAARAYSDPIAETDT